MKENLKTIAKINNVSILMIEDGESLVPIKPICEALGIDDKSQRNKIKDDEILSSVGVLSTSTGKDEKMYEMYCIPYKFIFGWLFTINAKNVKEEAREALLKYKLECYNALYDRFSATSKFLQEKQAAIIAQQEKVDEIRHNFNQTKTNLENERKRMKEITAYSFEEWQANNMQLKLFSAPEEAEEGGDNE